MNFAAGIGKVMEFLPKTIGASNHGVLTKTQLKLLAKLDDSGTVGKLIETVTNPRLEYAYKAQSNYSIAAIRLQDVGSEGTRTVARGAVSVVNPGENALVKARLSVGENGEVIRANGFIDASKDAGELDNTFASVRKNKGTISAEARVEDAFGANVKFDEEKAEQLVLNVPNGENAVGKVRKGIAKLGIGINEFMSETGRIFGGKSKKATSIPIVGREHVGTNITANKYEPDEFFKSPFPSGSRNGCASKLMDGVPVDPFFVAKSQPYSKTIAERINELK